MDNNETELADLFESSTNPAVASITQYSSNTEDEENRLLQIDYTHPFNGKDGMFETGIKGTQRQIDNDFGVQQLDENGDFI